MASRTKNMTIGNPLPLMLHFALPLMVGNLFQQLYTVVDTAVVGQALGVDALAALGASDWLYWMFLSMVQGITQGFGILMAQNFGAGDNTRLRKTLGNSILLAAASALVLMFGGQLIAKSILLLLKTPQPILPSALLYIRIMLWGLPIVMLYNLLASILRSLGDGRTPLLAMVLAALSNIVLDLLFVLVFHWGIPGAAIATLIAQCISSIYCLCHICKIRFLRLEKEDLSAQWPLCFHLMALGTPIALQNCVIAVGGMIIQMVVNRYGVVFIAGFTASNKLYGLLEMAASSFGYAIATYVGQNLGAGEIRRISKGVRSANVVALGTSAVITGIMVLLGKSILSLFLSGNAQEVDAAMAVAHEYLMVMSLSLPALYFLHVTRSAIQGIGNTILPMISGIVELFMRTSNAFILPIFMGSRGIFFSEVSAWFGADVVLAISYLICIRKIRKQYSLTEKNQGA